MDYLTDYDGVFVAPDTTALLSTDFLAVWRICMCFFSISFYIFSIYKGFLKYIFLYLINDFLLIYVHSRFRPLNTRFGVYFYCFLLFKFYYQNLLTLPTYFVVILKALCICIIDCNLFFTPLLLRYFILLFVCICIVLYGIVIGKLPLSRHLNFSDKSTLICLTCKILPVISDLPLIKSSNNLYLFLYLL